MKPNTRDQYIQRIDRVVSYLSQQACSTPSLQDLAGVAAISPFHFLRVYRAITGETPSATLRRLRLARAAAMLKETTKPINEIAFDVGYDSSQAFSKAFREATGVSASELRNDPEKLGAVTKALSSSPRQGTAGAPVLEVKLVSVDPFKVIASRHVGPHDKLNRSYRSLYDWAEKNNALEEFKGIYGVPLDDPRDTVASECRFDCCFDLGTNVSTPSELMAKMLGGGLFAVMRHVGPYEGLEEKYDYLFGHWLSTSGAALRDQPYYNHYLADPDTLPPEQWETDIYLPVAIGE